jgi:nucleoid-associated protein EbfC
MFKEIGMFASLLKNLPKIKEESSKLQQRLTTITAEGDAGAGMVRVKVNGKMEILSCTIAPEALQGGDKELLEDLIRGATNQALEKVKLLVADESGKLLGGMGFPGMPDLSGMMGP